MCNEKNHHFYFSTSFLFASQNPRPTILFIENSGFCWTIELRLKYIRRSNWYCIRLRVGNASLWLYSKPSNSSSSIPMSSIFSFMNSQVDMLNTFHINSKMRTNLKETLRKLFPPHSYPTPCCSTRQNSYLVVAYHSGHFTGRIRLLTTTASHFINHPAT
ncbi:hypothetical protein AAHE18_07G116100 [Arachis hypogaea]